MRRYLRCVAAVIGLAAGIAGCSQANSTGAVNRVAQTSNTPAHAPAALPGQPACFWLMNFNGSWMVLSQTEIIVYAPMYSEPYLIELMQPVMTLKFAESLGFYDVEGSGQICNGTMDDLVVPNWTPHRIPIIAVRRLTVSQANALLVQHGLRPIPSMR